MINGDRPPAGKPQHRNEIDSLRAVAMTAVVALHCHLLPFGWVGVWLFFVISGYVVTLSIMRQHDPEVPGSGLRRFIIQRVARILPPYYFYLALGLAVCLVNGISIHPVTWLSLLLFAHNIAMEAGVGEISSWTVGHLWTLSVEMQFYLVYGVLAHYLSSGSLRRLLWAFILLDPVMRGLVSLALHGTNPLVAAYVVYSAPGLHFDTFAMGCLLALNGDRGLEWPIIRRQTVLAATLLMYYLVTYLAIDRWILHQNGLGAARNIISGILIGQGREVFLYSVIGLAFVTLLQYTLARARYLVPLLDFRAAQWIGKVSYGGYIYHPFALGCAARLLGFGHNGPILNRMSVFAVGYGMTLVLAGVSLRWLEQPMARAIRKFLEAKPSPVPTLAGKAK